MTSPLSSANPAQKYDLFISYADDEAAWVEGYLLPALNLPLGRVVTKKQFQIGAPLIDEFVRAVEESRYTVLVFSPAYLADDWAVFSGKLIAFASIEEGYNRLVPLRLQAAKLPLDIRFRVSLDCSDQANWEPETARLRSLLQQPNPAPERIPCPYPGMVPFKEADVRFFYGRTAEIAKMIGHFRYQHILFVIGPSGSGKSSLLRAGLLPSLQTTSLFAPNFWLVRQIRPGAQPMLSLSAALAGNPDSLAQAVTQLLAANSPAQRLLLMVD